MIHIAQKNADRIFFFTKVLQPLRSYKRRPTIYKQVKQQRHRSAITSNCIKEATSPDTYPITPNVLCQILKRARNQSKREKERERERTRDAHIQTDKTPRNRNGRGGKRIEAKWPRDFGQRGLYLTTASIEEEKQSAFAAVKFRVLVCTESRH